MSNHSYIRIVGRLIRVVSGIIAAISFVTLLVSSVDCSMDLGWGWDCANRWILIVIIFFAIIITFGSLGIQRLLIGDNMKN